MKLAAVKRSPSVATYLCIFSPFTGMLYIGRPWLGLAYLGISVIGIYINALIAFYCSTFIIHSIILGFVVINLGAAYKAVDILKETENFALNRWYNKWYSITIAFIVFVIFYVPLKYIATFIVWYDLDHNMSIF